MNSGKLNKYKEIIINSIDIGDDFILTSTYPTIIFDKNFNIIFVNESALRLHRIPLNDVFMKNYFGVFCRDEDEYSEFHQFYQDISTKKVPVYVDNKQNNSYIMIFPILSPKTGEVEYYHNVFIVEDFHLTKLQKDNLRFSYDYAHFSHQLSVLLETKDKYTAKHSDNVTKYSYFLGEKLGISGIALEKLKLAASLHDIGKVNIDNSILNKTSALNDYEYNIIKTHSYFTGKILNAFDKLEDISDSGLYHHERYDGLGYPERLKGKEIPLNARIIAIADAFDAMTTDRPYRKAMSIEDAVNELKINSGTQFDPYLVDKFTNLDLKSVMESLSEFDNKYIDEYTVDDKSLEIMKANIKEMSSKVDMFVILENMVEYNFYGFIISDMADKYDTNRENRFEVLYKSGLVEDFIYNKYISGKWEMCLKEKAVPICNDCPVNRCLNLDTPLFKRTKLTNPDGEIKHLNTFFRPSYTNDTTYILEFFRDATTSVEYSDDVTTSFYNFIDNLASVFSEEHYFFSVIDSEIRNLANWIASKVNISNNRLILLNKAISICDLGIIGLYDSNEHSFESLKNLRTDTKHIEIIYNMITRLKSFADIKDIVLYHHIDYDDTSYPLSGSNVPIQSYIISTADFLLTSITTGKSVNDTIDSLELSSGTKASPLICNAILEEDNKIELIERLEIISNKYSL